MKTIIAILTAVIYCILCSCSTVGLYTKNQAIDKFCKTDSVTKFVTVRDTFHVPAQKADTIFTASPCDTSRTDSVTVQNGKVSATYKRKGNKIQLQANYLGDTAIKEKIIPVTVPCNCPPCPEPPAPTFWEKVFLQVKNALALIGITILVILTIRYIISKLSK